MQSRVIDIIVFLMERMQSGQKLSDIDIKDLESGRFNRSEISAAYSWIIQKHEQEEEIKSAHIPHRILHMAERLIIKPDAYGFLLELVNLGVLSSLDAEQIIENIMLESSERIDLPKMKDLVSNQLFVAGRYSPIHSTYLKGNETIN